MQIETGAARRLWMSGTSGIRPPTQPSCFRLAQEQLDANLIVGFEHLDDRAHHFMALRSQLLKHAGQTDQRLFAVTSVQPGNGKSHVAINLAAALSRIAPTLLVELDLRRPSMGARLGLPRETPGVDDFLDGKSAWRHTAVRIDGYDLGVHRVRKARARPESLLSVPCFEEMFELLRSREGRPICILDCPPAIVDDDIARIKRHVDGVLMVVEEARTPRRALREALASLAPAPLVGAILNKSISSAGPTPGYDYYRDQGPSRYEADEERIARGPRDCDDDADAQGTGR
jgi:Mrp family chromosome partitioning ATPase